MTETEHTHIICEEVGCTDVATQKTNDEVWLCDEHWETIMLWEEDFRRGEW